MRAKRSILITIFLPDSRERPAAYTLLSHAPSGAHAGVVQRQNVGFPSRTRGFDSRYPLQPQTGAYLQFYNAGAPSDPGTWQDGVAVAQRPHKPYGGGSNPSPATIWRRENLTQKGGRGPLDLCAGLECTAAHAGETRPYPAGRMPGENGAYLERGILRLAAGPRRVRLPEVSTTRAGENLSDRRTPGAMPGQSRIEGRGGRWLLG